jgi:DNA-binding YbaB/EbfC family protein
MSKAFGPLGNIMKQAQELQERLGQIQEQAGVRTVEATAGGGMVTVVVSGRLEIVALRIDPEVLKSGDIEMVQDLVIAAVNQGIHTAQEMMADEMKKVTGGLKIPGMNL